MKDKSKINKLIKVIDFNIEDQLDHFFHPENQKHFFGHLISEKEEKVMKEAAREELLTYKRNFIEGYKLVLDLASRGKVHFPSENFELHPWKQNEAILSEVNKTVLLQELFCYTPKMMREIYEVACEFYHAKEYEYSLNLSYFLSILNPTVFGFWQLLGRSYEGLEKWAQALVSYEIAINSHPDKIEGYEEAIRCCQNSKDTELANQFVLLGFEAAKTIDNVQDRRNFEDRLNQLKNEV